MDWVLDDSKGNALRNATAEALLCSGGDQSLSRGICRGPLKCTLQYMDKFPKSTLHPLLLEGGLAVRVLQFCNCATAETTAGGRSHSLLLLLQNGLISQLPQDTAEEEEEPREIRLPKRRQGPQALHCNGPPKIQSVLVLDYMLRKK